MGIGAMLVGLALSLVVFVFVARPFFSRVADLDEQVEIWIAEHRGGSEE
jgi:hypothetical protein